MKIHLVGSGGYIGQQIKAIEQDSCVCWSHAKNSSNYFNLMDQRTWDNLFLEIPENIIFLSWPGLPNYNQMHHLTNVLPQCIRFFEQLFANGCKNILVTGTCYEYGLQNGALSEDNVCDPVNMYGIAKDSLRRSLHQLAHTYNVRYAWLRIFYLYGDNQNPRSLYPSVLSAIKEKKNVFNISSGRQIRDFVHIDSVVKQILFLMKNRHVGGIFNCASGNPISIYEFVKKIIIEHNSNMQIRRGYYIDRDDEPLAFWANMNKYLSVQPDPSEYKH